MPHLKYEDERTIKKIGGVIWGIVALMLAAVGVGCRIAGLSLDLGSVLKAGFVIALCIAVSIYYRRWRNDRWISIGTASDHPDVRHVAGLPSWRLPHSFFGMPN